MKKYTIINTIVILILSVNYLFAQQGSLTPSQTLFYPTGTYGPTLIIASSLPDSFAYMHSKTYPFSSSSYRLLVVNSEAQTETFLDASTNYNIYNNNINSTRPKYKYLNVAIDAALEANFRRIIILEGEYQVDNSIVIDGIGTSDQASPYEFTTEAKGKITIEGEGYATRIVNAPTYLTGSIFDIRSSYNTLKNMSIISGGNAKNTCINLYDTATAGVGEVVRENIFENLYLGHEDFSNTTAPPNANAVSTSTAVALDAIDNRIGIKISSVNNQVGSNKFRNITFKAVDKGIVLEGLNRLHDNIFENLFFETTIVGIDFGPGVMAFDNVFSNIGIQTQAYTRNLIRNVSGTNNNFENVFHNDWNTANGNSDDYIKMISLSGTSSHTTIKDSELDVTSSVFFEDLGSFTQLINCFNSGGGGVLDYKLGSTQGTSKINLLGRVIIGNTNDALFTELNTQDPNKNYKLIVNGKVRVREEVYVKQGGLTWPDYVFAKNYNLMPLPQVEKYIQEKGYLPNMPSAAEVEKEGIAVGDLIKRQQEKIEELTLYLIEMKKEIEALKQPKK